MRDYIEAKERENVGKGFKLGKLKRKERHMIMKKGDLGAISNKILSVLSEGKKANENLDEKLIREVYLREGYLKKKIIIRADTLGLLESIEDEMLRNFNEKTLDEVIIDSGVGALTEDDFKFAKNSNAIFFCFNMDQEVDDYAISYGVGVRKHKLIYNIIEEVRYFINEANLVDPSIENSEEDYFKGRAIVKDIFKIKVTSKIFFIS
jgi:translation initiation factor IF-2